MNVCKVASRIRLPPFAIICHQCQPLFATDWLQMNCYLPPYLPPRNNKIVNVL